MLRSQRFVAELLSPHLGNEKADELVAQVADRLGFGSELSCEQASEVLEQIAQSPGVVGITARFAKSRMYLRWDKV